ncbi:MAG TPA: hypothetical protein VFE47_00400 [Tepidisphaeraceae bacterium]|nr:hypothetical protein [Tepidisphaeraceae bacterium]
MPSIKPDAIQTSSHASASETFIDVERGLSTRWGTGWASRPQAEISRAIVVLAESLPPGGAINLPGSVASGTLDFRGIADDVQITGGHDGTIVLGTGQRGIQLLFSSLDEQIEAGVARPLEKLDLSHPQSRLADARFKDISVFGEPTAPASDLLALFNHGGIRINADVKNCAWICGENAFGKNVVTADARVDNSLFLWFGINWPFQDYNAHWDPKNAGRNWVKENAQLHFNLHGGGQGTRLYEMIETNYGNPGPGAVFENCDGLAVYHGSTERASSQGPGVYYLRDCRNMQLGLRGINAFGQNNGDPRNADAARDITIEGGNGNILYAMRIWSNSNDVSLWNSDPNLQLWEVACQFEMKGIDNSLKFAVTPNTGKPTAAYWAAHDLGAKVQGIMTLRARKIRPPMVNPDTQASLTEKVRTGRHLEDVPLNASEEITFEYGKADLVKAEKATGKIPPPPVVPAADAPVTRQTIAFTQAPEFGKKLLAVGADPTGQKPSDDAFSQYLYGRSREELQKLIDQAEKLEGDYRKIRDERDARIRKLARDDDKARDAVKAEYEPQLKPIQQQIAENWKQFAPKESRGKGKAMPRLESPAGKFLLTRPLYILREVDGIFGAGPEKTILRTDQPIQVVKMQVRCTLANMGIDGGTAGLAMTGSNHDDEVSPALHSYIAGQDFYNITFRNQTFAGIQVGNDQEGLMGGSEHDQNKYVDLRFINTGSYGIYFNVGMLDKWLCLHNEFSGQKKAGIACQFNNLIHGCIVGSSFSNIDGPGVDFFGGNVEIGFRPWEVWIDGCDFTECGNQSHFAVEQGLCELSAFTHNTVVTKSKKIAGGYAGSPQICQDNIIDVSLADGAPALKLRGVRTISVSRANGHVLRDVKANGPLVFVNDADQNGTLFDKTIGWLSAHGKAHVARWDTNPMAHELAPADGWTHPFIFYNCDIGGRHYSYDLLNVDVDKGTIKQEIDISAIH